MNKDRALAKDQGPFFQKRHDWHAYRRLEIHEHMGY